MGTCRNTFDVFRRWGRLIDVRGGGGDLIDIRWWRR